MNLSRILYWSTVLSLPTIFLFGKRRPGEVAPGPEADAGDGEIIVIEPSEPPMPFPRETMPAGMSFPPSPEGYSRMSGGDVPAEVMPLLRPLLAGDIGTRTKLPAPGRDILAQIEPHYHEPGGRAKPWGWHKGVSLWERKGQVT